MNEKLTVHSGEAMSTDRASVATVATFGADTHVNVTVCDGRPESEIDEVTGNAVRMVTNSSRWDDDKKMIRVSTTTALTPAQALSLARDLIAQASTLLVK